MATDKSNWAVPPPRTAVCMPATACFLSLFNQWCLFLTNYSISIELYKLLVHIFGLAVVRRLLHAGLRDILPLKRRAA